MLTINLFVPYTSHRIHNHDVCIRNVAVTSLTLVGEWHTFWRAHTTDATFCVLGKKNERWKRAAVTKIDWLITNLLWNGNEWMAKHSSSHQTFDDVEQLNPFQPNSFTELFAHRTCTSMSDVIMETSPVIDFAVIFFPVPHRSLISSLVNIECIYDVRIFSIWPCQWMRQKFGL